MSYVDAVLQPGEKVVHRGHLHWVLYWQALALAIVAVVLLLVTPPQDGLRATLRIAAGVAGVLAFLAAVKAGYDQWITEVAVTDRRVIYKRGLIRRVTAEMHIDKVESVSVNQSILGRLLDYGTIDMRGTGGGIEDLRTMADPIAFRNAITAR